MIKTVALISSGLDSMLAAKIMHDLGIEVTGLHCQFHFDPTTPPDYKARFEALYKPIGIPVVIKDITDAFVDVVLNPAHGYGSEINPCIDCKIFMFSQAKRMMEETGARFIVTGEVVGQRPMTQKRPMMYHIEKEAGLKGRVVRPLCAKRLRPTIPEEEGWIHRQDLYDIAGRGRKDQLSMIKNYGIDIFNQPAGGCILTSTAYSKRAKALFKYREQSTITARDLQLLRLGRHFWIDERLHIIAGRDEEDNRYLYQFREERAIFEARDTEGPVVLAEGICDEKDLYLASEITARYCKKTKPPVAVLCHFKGTEKILNVCPADENDIEFWRI